MFKTAVCLRQQFVAHGDGLFKECGGDSKVCVSTIVTVTLLTGLRHAKPQFPGGT